MTGRQNNRRRESRSVTYLVHQSELLTRGGFFDDACYRFFWSRLTHRLGYYRVQLHAYLLVPEAVWLLLTAQSQEPIDRLLEGVNAAYGDYFNTRFQRSVLPWSHRQRCSPITCSGFVPVCQKYIEREPLRLGLVTHPGAWPWSSYSCNAFGGKVPFVTAHEALRQFTAGSGADHKRYREFVAAPFEQAHENFLRNRIERNLALPVRMNPRIRGYRAIQADAISP